GAIFFSLQEKNEDFGRSGASPSARGGADEHARASSATRRAPRSGAASNFSLAFVSPAATMSQNFTTGGDGAPLETRRECEAHDRLTRRSECTSHQSSRRPGPPAPRRGRRRSTPSTTPCWLRGSGTST